MIQICKPEKAAPTLLANLERAVLLPKFVMAYSKDGQTQVRVLRYGEDLVADLIDDRQFGQSMQQTFDTLCRFIDQCA